MRRFNKRQRLEMISMISGDKESIELGHLMCQSYMSQQPNDSKFKQKYWGLVYKHNKMLRKRKLKWATSWWTGITTSNHLNHISGIQIIKPKKYITLINI